MRGFFIDPCAIIRGVQLSLIAIAMTTRTKPGIRANSATRDAVPAPDIARKIGWTPLLKLPRLSAGLTQTVTVYAKGEHLNPSGS